MTTLIKFFSSKINILAIVSILMSLQSQLSGLDISKLTTQEWINFAIGVLIIIFRTFGAQASITPMAERNMAKLNK